MKELIKPRSKFIEDRMRERTLIGKPSRTELLKIIEAEALGPKSKKILREMLDFESPAHLYYSTFRCPPVIERGEGALVWDVDGREYIDFIGGWGVNNIGYGHPKLLEAIKNQCDMLIQYAEQPHKLRLELAQELTKITPGNHKKKIHYTTTGGEAVEASIQFARYYTGRPTIIGFYGAYHGRTLGATAITSSARNRYTQGIPADIGVVHVPYAYCYRCLFGGEYPDCDMQCTRYIDELMKSNSYGLRQPTPIDITNVAAILVEPMQGSSGFICPPEEFLRNLRRIADDYGLLLVADEVYTGWGRTGKLWACEHSGVIPDILVTGKSMSGGIPMSVSVIKAEIADGLGPGAHSSTFGGTPLACAAALAVIKVFKEEGLVKHAAKMGEYLMKGLNDLAEKHLLIGNINGKGLFIGVELVKDRKTKDPATAECKSLQRECLKRGLILATGGYFGNILKVSCPLVITEEQADRALEILDETLSMVEGVASGRPTTP